MSCNPTVNSFNHFLEQYIDWSKCELEMCDKEISCRKCKENMLSVYNNKIRKEEREKIIDEIIVLLHDKLYQEEHKTFEQQTNALINRCITQISNLK